MNETSKTGKAAADPAAQALAKDWKAVSGFLRQHPGLLRQDAALLGELGLWIRADNIVEFGPAALARLSADSSRERAARRRLEATARSNFAAQAQTHAAVVDLLEARNHADLARRLDEIARLRFGLLAGAIGLETPGATPAGWRGLAEGHGDRLMAPKVWPIWARRAAQALFGDLHDQVGSVAMVRMAIWEPARQGVLAFASAEAGGFAAEMGTELVAFLARVVERTAERWPVL